MNKPLLLAAGAAALAMLPATAHAQLIGGGGGIGGTLGGAISTGPIGSTIDRTTTTVRQSARGAARTEGSQKVDRRQGRVRADRSAQGDAAASGDQLATGPLGALTSSASGSGSAAGSGALDAQLVGTDELGRTAGGVVSSTRATATATRQQAKGFVPAAPTTPTAPATGGASGAASLAGSGSGALASPLFAAAGSAAADANGAFAIAPGMPVLAPGGDKLGKVREVVADSRGRVQQVIVQAGKLREAIPANALSVSGEALVAASGAGKAAAE